MVACSDALVYHCAVVVKVSHAGVAVLAVRCQRRPVDSAGLAVAGLVYVTLIIEEIFICRYLLRFLQSELRVGFKS